MARDEALQIVLANADEAAELHNRQLVFCDKAMNSLGAAVQGRSGLLDGEKRGGRVRRFRRHGWPRSVGCEGAPPGQPGERGDERAAGEDERKEQGGVPILRHLPLPTRFRHDTLGSPDTGRSPSKGRQRSEGQETTKVSRRMGG